ncbi:hypothetical protein J2T57_003099 [Natronocella acetinitrilica]|uniref:DUF2007 domain-containing protein n=1 Tax=Natronocella acetinitrilica TaxID=414046 RepID=A0AAE3G6I3_9GAMM|nr:DUF6164 family protein [Natronocella acetinitrilica]MCP1675944.1 hypothetical protein [Natronocella acetinitrilica]
MAKLLMHLRGVSDEEADEVRELLSRHQIDYYETPPNHWGLTMGAIWLRDEDQKDEASQLLDTYQQERQQRVREEYAARREAGEIDTVLTRILREPVRFLVYLGIIGTILYFLITPFFRLG